MSNDNATPIDQDVQQTTEQEPKRYFLIFRKANIVTPDIPDYELGELDYLDLDNAVIFTNNEAYHVK